MPRILNRRRPPSSGHCWTSGTNFPTRKPPVSVSAPVAQTVRTARIGSGRPSRWMTMGHAPRSPRIFASSTCPTPRTSSRRVATAPLVGNGPPPSWLPSVHVTTRVGPSRLFPPWRPAPRGRLPRVRRRLPHPPPCPYVTPGVALIMSFDRRQPRPPASGCHFLHGTASQALHTTSGRLWTCSKKYMFASCRHFVVRICHFSAEMSSAATGRF